jgi:hypothetical protein
MVILLLGSLHPVDVNSVVDVSEVFTRPTYIDPEDGGTRYSGTSATLPISTRCKDPRGVSM